RRGRVVPQHRRRDRPPPERVGRQQGSRGSNQPLWVVRAFRSDRLPDLESANSGTAGVAAEAAWDDSRSRPAALFRNLNKTAYLRRLCAAGTERSPASSLPALLTKSLSDLYLEGHRVVPPGVLDNELVFPVLRRRDFHRTLRAGRVVLADFLPATFVDVQVHVVFLRPVRRGLDLFPRREGQEVGDLALVLHLDLLALDLRPLALVGRLLCGTQRGEREYSRCCGD